MRRSELHSLGRCAEGRSGKAPSTARPRPPHGLEGVWVGVEAPVDDRPEELDHSRPHVVQEAIGLSEGLARVQSIEETLITRVGGSCSDTGADASYDAHRLGPHSSPFHGVLERLNAT